MVALSAPPLEMLYQESQQELHQTQDIDSPFRRLPTEGIFYLSFFYNWMCFKYAIGLKLNMIQW